MAKNNETTITTDAYVGQGDEKVQIVFSEMNVTGNGSFGTVYKAKLVSPVIETIAIKKVVIDTRYKNRELQTMKLLDHQNIVKLKYHFSTSDQSNNKYLNLVLEFIPDTVYYISRSYSEKKLTMPLFLVKLYMYQLFRSLAYIHNKGICHRDIKPQNLLVNKETGVLKLCDFGSAKILKAGETNVSYICSRFFRAPELIFGAVEYTCQIDVWSTGCVLAELLLGEPIFPGESAIDQLVEIIKVLGTPTREQINSMNPEYKDFSFPEINKSSWEKVFATTVPTEPINLVSKLLDYRPTLRLIPIEAMKHEFFYELRNPKAKLPNDMPLPLLFNFTTEEQNYQPGFADFFKPMEEQVVTSESNAQTRKSPSPS